MPRRFLEGKKPGAGLTATPTLTLVKSVTAVTAGLVGGLIKMKMLFLSCSRVEDLESPRCHVDHVAFEHLSRVPIAVRASFQPGIEVRSDCLSME